MQGAGAGLWTYRYRDIQTADGVLLLVTIYLNILNTSCLYFVDITYMHASHPLTSLDASPVTMREDNILPVQCSVNPRCCLLSSWDGSRSAVDGDGEGHKMGSGRLSDVARRGWVWPGCGA